MCYNRFSVSLLPVLLSFIFISCSSSGTVTKQPETASPESKSGKYPEWYNESQTIHSDDTAYFGYATALATDSVRSHEKAVVQAQAELKSAISSRLELIRKDALAELGNNSGLDNPRFIMALRNAENEVHSVAQTVQKESQKNGEKIFRSFTKVSAEKSAVLAQLDKALSNNSKTWERMKKAKAFQKF